MMRDLGNRCQSNKHWKSILNKIKIIYQVVKHHCSSHRVTNIGNLLLTSFILDFSDHSWKVVFSVFWERKVPKLRIIVWIQVQVLTTVLVASEVTQPSIITSINSNKRRSFWWLIHDPGISWVEKAMLEENGRFWGVIYGDFFASFAWNTEKCEHILIFGCDLISFELVIVLSTEFRESFVHIIRRPSENTFKLNFLS